MVVPESIKALMCFLACTVTVGQSEISSLVNHWGCGCPPHLSESSSLLKEGSRSLKYPNFHLILRRNPSVRPEWWPSVGAGIYGEISVSEHGFNVFHGCKIYCTWGVPGARPTVISEVVSVVALVSWVFWCVAPLTVLGILVGMSSRIAFCRGLPRMAVVMGYRVGCMPLVVTGASVTLELIVWSWPVKAVPLAASVMERVWPVPVAVVMMQVGVGSVMMTGYPKIRQFFWGSLGKWPKSLQL